MINSVINEIGKFQPDKEIVKIANKIISRERISSREAIYLYQHAELGLLGILADHIKNQQHGNKVFYNINFHLEPTNVCAKQCKFCTFCRKEGDPDAWMLSMEELLDIVQQYRNSKVTEIHIVGGVYRTYDLKFYSNLIKAIKEIMPEIHVKAFTAVEIEYLSKLEKITPAEVLNILKNSGLDSLPGGGAEILDDNIRTKICPKKTDSATWLDIHKSAHLMGIPTNCTMLYGHIESYEARIAHMEKLRYLQDQTHGFNAFIPLKFRNQNDLFNVQESTLTEDMKTYAIARLFFDNIAHIKAYWPMLGKSPAQMALSFGVDDIDGTIDDTTKIYSMSGVEESQRMDEKELLKLVEDAGYLAYERDSFYNILASVPD